MTSPADTLPTTISLKPRTPSAGELCAFCGAPPPAVWGMHPSLLWASGEAGTVACEDCANRANHRP